MFILYQLAAKGGIAPALHNIANCYAAGRGTKQSDHNAVMFYEAAIEAGDPSSMFALATWRKIGRFVAKDPKIAHELSLRAANLGHPGAMFNVGCNYMSGQHVDQKDLVMAAEWFEKSANKGFIHAAMNLGKMYYEGTGVSRDLLKAKQILEPFAERSDLCRQSVEIINEELSASTSPIAVTNEALSRVEEKKSNSS